MLFFVFGGMFSVFGLILVVSALAGTHPIAELPTYIVYVVIGAVLILLGVNRRRQAAKAEELRRQQAEQRRREEEEAAKNVEESEEKVPSVTLPNRIGRAHQKYRYDKVDFVPTKNADAICEDIVESGKYALSIRVEKDGRIFFESYAGETIGEFVQQNRLADMIIDYTYRKDPILTYLTLYDSDTSVSQVTLAFYRDVEASCAGREKTTHPLTHYRSSSIQDTILYSVFYGGETLDYDEDDDDPNKIWILYKDDPIGLLPRSITARFVEEEPLIFLDHIGNDENDKYVPYVNLYW